MRPLNRPMFRYGGPIKEGIMSGIREPRANGGRAALVGNPVYPQTGGREHHNILKTIFGWGVKPVLGAGTKQATKKTVGTETAKGIKSLWQKYGPDFRLGRKIKKPLNIKSAPHIRENIYTTKGVPFMEKVGRFVKKNKGWTAAGGVGATSEPGQAILKAPFGIAKWTSEALTPKWAEKYLPWEVPGVKSAYKTPWSPDKKLGKDDGTKEIPETNPWKEKYEALVEENKVPKKSDEEIRAEKLQKYRDIMDIKGMNSEAAANSLIEASRLINESQDFKGDIRSGKLINRIIQGTSKAYDKPADMKRAIDTLIVKSEIQHDLNKEEKALANEVKRKQIEIYDKQLAGKTLNERIGEFRTKHQKNPSGNSLEGILLDIDIPVVDVADTTQVNAHIKNVKGGDEVSFMESIVEANVKEGKSVTPGVYVVKDKIIIIDENGKVKKKR